MPRLPRKVARRSGRHRRQIPVQGRRPVPETPHLPRKTTVDVSLYHACHAILRWMSPNATPATQSGAAPRTSQATNPSPRAPPSTRNATPATQNDGRCEIAPRLPHDITVDVTNCHANAPAKVCVCEVIAC